MLSLYCKKCNYKFLKDKIPKRCPYCSRTGTIGTTRSAQDLLDDVVKNMSE